MAETTKNRKLNTLMKYSVNSLKFFTFERIEQKQRLKIQKMAKFCYNNKIKQTKNESGKNSIKNQRNS